MPKINSKEELDCIDKTMEHKLLVKELLTRIAEIVIFRANNHDNSKLEEPEFELFTKYTPILAELTYGSEEYQQALNNLQPALIHHYANSRHHPEHFKNGIKDMNIIDIMEMFVDWYCASKRHNNGNIRKSIDLNKKRFKYSNDLKRIFENSIELLDK